MPYDCGLPMNTEKTMLAINAYIENHQEDGNRNHLGASVIGRTCGRSLWYLFRWVHEERHLGRILRLFDRGHLEEARFVKWFRDAGIRVWDRDADGKQIRIIDCKGHFGGSLDGICKGVPDLDHDELCLVEFKSHSEKSFNQLLRKKVKLSKPEHYAQMNIYMGKMSLKWGLYAGINKNTDEIYLELLPFDVNNYKRHMDRAEVIIRAAAPPLKINESPGWWQCRFCSYKNICHKGECPEINCRTCCLATPIEDGNWSCAIQQPEVLEKQVGCGHHIIIPTLVPFEMVNVNEEFHYIEYKAHDGSLFKQGPGYFSSRACKENNFKWC